MVIGTLCSVELDVPCEVKMEPDQNVEHEEWSLLLGKWIFLASWDPNLHISFYRNSIAPSKIGWC